MPRHREFDPADAVQRAMETFWRQGYADTSVDDLVHATGVSRHGLYEVFENKKGLYLGALDHYARTVVTEALAALEEDGAGLDAIRRTFETLLQRARSGAARYGCLLCNAAEEVSPFDADVSREVETYQCRVAEAFARAVRTARSRGEIPATVDPGEMGEFLAGLIQGASFLARSPAPASSIEQFVQVGLRVLQ